jgi:hypothetical protein
VSVLGVVSKVVKVNFEYGRVPDRPKGLADDTRLISLFAKNRALVAFVQNLFHNHDILTVSDWDIAGKGMLNRYSVDDVNRRIFLTRIGKPLRPFIGGAKILTFGARL